MKPVEQKDVKVAGVNTLPKLTKAAKEIQKKDEGVKADEVKAVALEEVKMQE